jgi:hypothetical protein
MSEPQLKRLSYITTLLVTLLLAGAVGAPAFGRTPESATNQSLNWTSYRNEIYGIEFRFPIDWSITLENRDVDVYEQIKRLCGRMDVVALDRGSAGTITIRYFGTNLNFNCDACPSTVSREECERLRELYKLSLDRFMELVKRNDVWQNTRKTLVNGYNAYEIPLEQDNMFSIMIENRGGEVFQIAFANRSTKNDLSPIELQIISTITFIDR